MTGNPLSVLDLMSLESGDPADGWLAAVAREMNQTETTFVFPATPTADARLRSFTAGGVEVFGVGHNALGAWWWLLESGRVPRPVPGTPLVQAIGGCDLEVDVDVDDHGLVMRQTRPVFGDLPDDAVAVQAIGVAVGDLDHEVPPRVVGTGSDHLMVAVRDPDVLDTCRPDKELLIDATSSVGAQGLYVAAVGLERPVRTVHTRFFNPGVGLDEDPATGSAAGPLTAYLDALGLLGEDLRLRIEQGQAMGRPSILTTHITSSGAPTVGGSGVVTAQGWIRGPEE